MTTPVIFRVFKDGAVIALFPTLPHDREGALCESYMRIGQHGGADPGIVGETEPAKPEQYQSLLTELESIGYDDLKIYRRISRAMTGERIRQAKGNTS